MSSLSVMIRYCRKYWNIFGEKKWQSTGLPRENWLASCLASIQGISQVLTPCPLSWTWTDTSCLFTPDFYPTSWVIYVWCFDRVSFWTLPPPLQEPGTSPCLHPGSVLPVLALYHGAQAVTDLSGEPPLVQLTHPVLEGWIQHQQVLPLGHDCQTQVVLYQEDNTTTNLRHVSFIWLFLRLTAQSC